MVINSGEDSNKRLWENAYDKDREIERLKQERVGLQNRITNTELKILSTHLLTKMLSASTEGRE